ncbi:molybdenum cofactor guanylyltransferase MobA [Methyloferula stellata]|uniref:molybdenum cofactor guanylyltransferase MobA n=1 Tax=Methyloferula stellata TaxID=876270 RepID=UPI00035DB462|nr:molybdenum cofactor guanylyltransferase MobA [Methyloferula stellata]
MSEPVFGILLAGGLARRMGGGDKGLKVLGGETILSRIIRAVAPQCAGLVLNANGDVARLADLGFPIVPDDVPDFAGPLAGILAGLDWIAEHHPECTCAVSVPTDTPFLPADLVVRLLEARSEAKADIAIATSGGSTHPVVALWPVAIRQDLRKALVDEHIHKMGFFIDRHKVAHADWPVEPYDPFFNANEPEDIAQAEKILAERL